MRVEVDGLELTQGQLMGVEDRLNELGPYFEAVAANLEEHKDEMFETWGRTAGRAWKRPARATLDARARRVGYYGETPGGGVAPLKWSGTLQRSFRVIRMGATEMIWGTQAKVANLLLGKRPVIKFKRDQESELIVEPLEEHIEAGVTQRGRLVRRRRRR